jgi:hypothetical protein
MSGNTKAKLIAGAVLLLALAAFGGWQYMHSAHYVAAQQLKQAAAAAAAGQPVQAAELFAGVALSQADSAPEGRAGLRGLLQPAVLRPLPAGDAARVLAQALRLRPAVALPVPAKELLALGWQVVDARAASDPAGAKRMLDTIAPLETDKARLAAAAEPLLERIVAAEPANAAAAIEYAELLERRRDFARCEALLAPHAARLGKGEGARILGQIYAAKGLADESYALLQPYTEDKLKLFAQREAEYRKTVESLEKAALDQLRAGSAPKSFYDDYDKADEQGKRALVGNYINQQLREHAGLKQQVQGLRDSAAIVPAALDLGIVTVHRAQKLGDPAARQAQFEAAEKVFLSIRGVAGDSDNYRLYLGQVYYWLGKHDDGKKLFDELLQAHGRDHRMLLDVGGLLRSVGALHDARALVEEAHAKAKTSDERWSAAQIRAVMYVDADDELAWLERSDRSSGRVRASIHTTKAQLAERKGQRALAKREYELAVVELSKLPEDASQHNSLALVHLALYAMEGDPLQRDRGLARLDQALALQPADSILLLNNISAVSSAAVASIVGDTIDLPALRSGGDFGLVEFLHNDDASRERMRQKLRDNPAVKKALAYSEKAALLAPRNPQSYTFLATLAGALDDGPAMKALAARVQAAQLDLNDADNEIRKFAEGKGLESRLEAQVAHAEQLAKVLQQPAVLRQPATYAVAAGRWIEAQATLARWGRAIDADALVRVARKARAGHASAGTHSLLMKALDVRAALRLAKAHPAFAAAVARHARLLDLSSLTVIHMDEDPAFRQAALADADIVELMALVRERETRYPTRTSVWSWLLFRHADARQAAVLAARLRDDPTQAAGVAMGAAFAPRHVDSVVDRYYLALAGGARDKAQQVLDEARRAGVALPELLGRQLKSSS